MILVLLAFTFLTPLIEFLRQAQCMPKFVLNIIGSTGTRKSTMAALFLCFFGIFNAGNLPMSFRDTANSIIQNAFALKDVLTCIDDFHPCGRDDERKLTATMQALVRSYGDRTGRGRLRKDSSPMESRPPLGNAIVTSEYPPDIGESGTARYFLLELKDGDVNLDILSSFQQYAEQGIFRRAMFGYTEWIRKKFLQAEKIEEGFVRTLKESFAVYRSDFIHTLFAEHEVVCPSVYAFKKTGKRSGHLDLNNPYQWTITTIRRMLSNRFYVGDTVNFKTYSKSNKLKKRIKNEPENILIFENTHEAIIDRKTFDIVQKHFKGRKRPDAQGNMDKYAGYLYCGDCGKRMYLHRSKTMPAEKNYFQCGGYQQGKSRCTVHNIKEQVLDTLVLAQLKSMISMASNHSDEFYAIATEKGKAEAKKYYDSAEKEKSQLTARLHDLDNIIRCLYEDRVVGRITPERYDFLASGYEEEQAQIRTKLNELNEKINEIDLQEKYVKEFIAKAKEYINIEKLTPEILRAFIKRIDVYEKEVKYSHTCGNTIVIQYTFQLDKN